MTPERWARVGSLYRAVLERAPGERTAFLRQASGDDHELLREVESLLAAEEGAGHFLSDGAMGDAAKMLAGEERASLAGRTLDQYRVERELGRGGMGQVYLARDSRLDRPVALKLLPASFSFNEERVSRFRREARAVSLLNHPHIVTIHEIGEADGLRFIVTEYVEGRTLRELIEAGKLSPGQALDIAVQVASALAAAHEAGVVHRDVKPENVMLRPDGYVKVLDFGLAKLAEQSGAGDSSDAGESATLLMHSTSPGLVMGTISYMSPEQARGLKVDARTDVWSLGVVLYEMVAGQQPFGGKTTSDVLVSILSKEPTLLADYVPDAPAELLQIISKALSKESQERYSTMREMLADLREAREETAFRVRQELHTSTGGALLNPSLVAAAPSQRGQRRMRALWATVLVIAVAALSFGIYAYIKSRRAPPPQPKMTRLTANGKILRVAVTRDGKHIAYAAGPQQGLWVMQSATGSNVQIVPPAEGVIYWGLTFSPDGDYVYFVRNVGSGPWELDRVPTLGGTPKRLLENVDSAVTFSPDGRQMAFGRQPDEQTTLLMVSNTDGTGERVVAARKRPQYFNLAGLVKIAWSPDGESIACPAWNAESPDEYIYEVVAVSLKDGSERPLTRRKWTALQQVAWLGDGSGLVMIAQDEFSSPAQVWHLSYPEGSARPLTNDFNSYDDISVTADSASLLTVQTDWLSNVWVAPAADAARARQITDGRNDGFHGLSWTPDGRVVFGSKVGGNVDIWVMDADGGNRRRLTDYADWDAEPSVSIDGRHIVFESRRAGGLNIWRMDADGGHPVQLTHGQFEYGPRCSPDGRWVYYSALSSEKTQTVWKVPVEGGDAVQVTVANGTIAPAVSPDQKWLAYRYSDLQANPPYGWAVAPVEGGPPVRRFDIHHKTRTLDWTPDARALAYIDLRSVNVVAQPIDGGPPRPLTDFKSDQTFFFSWSRDGKQLALARGTRTSDLVMITGFK